jgi:hypothetical protein
MPTNNRILAFLRPSGFLSSLLLAGVIAWGNKRADAQEKAENTAPPFDAQKVVKLSNEAFKVGWDARFWAVHDLRFAAFRPRAEDFEAIDYLSRTIRDVPSVAREIKKHPTTARSSSMRSIDFVRYDMMMLKLRYQPSSYRKSTNAKMQKLLGIVDEILSYYDQKDGTNVSKDGKQANQTR